LSSKSIFINGSVLALNCCSNCNFMGMTKQTYFKKEVLNQKTSSF
jgi:hypothetical protein